MHLNGLNKALLFAALVVVAGCASLQASDKNTADLVLANANVVDASARRVYRGHVAIRDGRILGITRGRIPKSAKILDLPDRWVMPALVDAHTHSGANIAPARGSPRPMVDFFGTEGGARRMLYSGVFAFIDLFAVEDSILTLRDRQRQGGWQGAELLAAGPCLTAPKGHCTEYGIPTRTISSPADAQREIASLAARRPDVIKLVYDNSGYLPTIDSVTLLAAVAAARQAGIPSVVHVSQLRDVRGAVRAGATAVTHLPRREVIPPDLAREIAERGMYYIPTMVTPADAAVLAREPAIRDDLLLRAVASARLIDAYADSAALPQYLVATMRQSDAIAAVYRQSMTNLSNAGVRLIVGSDAGNFGSFLGWSTHRELARFVEAGLSPWDAIIAGTTTPGQMLGRKWGMRAGDEANLLVLAASPIEDIANTRRITHVIQRGVLVDRMALLAKPNR